MADDQFSFPIVSNHHIPHLIQSSSSLWRISSRVFHHGDYDSAGIPNFSVDEARSVVVAEKEEAAAPEDGKMEEEEEEEEEEDMGESMDMLWEDFNTKEEINEGAKLAQLRGFTMSTRNASMGRISRKRATGMAVVAKSLRKKLQWIRRRRTEKQNID
ncbi:hypothetical protein Dimus_021570 [Dionaea muscipula]